LAANVASVTIGSARRYPATCVTARAAGIAGVESVLALSATTIENRNGNSRRMYSRRSPTLRSIVASSLKTGTTISIVWRFAFMSAASSRRLSPM